MKHFICLVFILMISISVYADTMIVYKFGGYCYTINDGVDVDVISIYPAIYLESEYISIKIMVDGIDVNFY